METTVYWALYGVNCCQIQLEYMVTELIMVYDSHNSYNITHQVTLFGMLLSTTKAQFCIPGSQDSSFHLGDSENRLRFVKVLKSANHVYIWTYTSFLGELSSFL